MKKQITAILLATLMLLSFALQSSAMVVDNAVSPCWTNMTQVTIDIEFSDDNVGNASLLVSRAYGVTTSIEATFYIYYKSASGSWKYLDGTSGSSNGSLYLEVEFDAESGTEYKAVADITANSQTLSESDTLYETRTCP